MKIKLMKGSLIWLLVLFSLTTFGQSNLLSIGIGQSYYRGDLSPYASPFSFGEGHNAYTIAYHRTIAKRYRLGVELLNGRISADDLLSPLSDRRDRSLNFYADITQISLLGSFLIGEVSGDKAYTGLQLWATMGIGALHCDPMTDYMGKRERLRRYGTEGQLIDGRSIASPWHLSTPLGLDIALQLSARWTVSLELNYNIAWTDYLDDVSGYYPNMSLLKEQVGMVAVALSDRGGPSDVDKMRDLSGMTRGDDMKYDGFLVTGLSLSYTW